MRLLASVLPQVRKLVPSAERGLSLFLVAFLGGLEFLGRLAPSDLYDAVAGLAVVSVGTFVLSWHRRYPLPWLVWANRLAAALADRVGRLKYEIGIDFRGRPPLPRKAPRAVVVGVMGVLAWTALAAAAWAAFPGGWREIGLRTSYVVYLLVLMAVWAMLAGCALAGVYLPVWTIDQRLKLSQPAGPDGPGVDAVALVGYGLLAVLVAWVTPPVYAVALCLAVAIIAGLAYAAPGGGDASVVWRSGPDRPVYAVPMKRVLLGGLSVAALIVFALLVTAAGGRLTATPVITDPMLVTALLGSLTAWLVPGVAAVVAYQLLQHRRTDPARTTPPTVHVGGETLSLNRAAAFVTRWGWRVRVGAGRPAVGEVGVRLVPPAESEATEFDPRWPLKVSVADMTAGVQERLRRRDEIQLRRKFFRGLETLLKQAKAAAPSPGGGFWVAPHWWFIDSVQWEEPDRPKDADAEQLRPVGPRFDAAFPPRVRQYVYQLFRTVEVDLIYLEDGISHKNLARVLRSLLEVYDVHGGRRRVEDHHFHGHPKVRVMLHEYAPGNPFRASAGYPEPKFDEVSRFRVMHVFKDRGGDEVAEPTPFDFSWEPSPLGVG